MTDIYVSSTTTIMSPARATRSTLSRAKEFLIISRLGRDFGRPVNHLNLWIDVRGDQTEYKKEVLKVHIANIRRKLAPYGLGALTMVNIGYRLIQIPTHNPDVSSHIK
jgi:DNA-binding response OmpR family regulator